MREACIIDPSHCINFGTKAISNDQSDETKYLDCNGRQRCCNHGEVSQQLGHISVDSRSGGQVRQD